MVRSAAAFLAVLILPGLAFAQQPQGSHTVVVDDTLWDLAQRYYSSPWEWRMIWEANRSEIDDPNLIYPGQVFTIPGVPTRDQTAGGPPAGGGAEPDEQPGGGEPGGGDPGMGPGGPSDGIAPADRRTIFYRQQEPTVSVVAMLDREYVAVDVDQVYSAPYLGPMMGAPEHIGTLRGFALQTDRGSTVRQFHQVTIDTDSPVRVGDQLRTFRVTKSIPQVGQVVTPTGVLTVTAVGDTTAVAVVSKEYGRIQAGDLIGPLPPYSVAAGARAQDVSGGSEAMIMGAAGRQQLNDLGHHLFIDLGTDHGIGVGDEFVLYSDAVSSEVRGRLQVVGVMPTSSTVRISAMSDEVFHQGVIVRLVRQMP
jgi:hypothetical protein